MVTLVVPFAAGGSADITARRMADLLSKKWGQPVVVENKPGAGSVLGGLHVARAAPDGYTLLLSADPLLSTTQLMYKEPKLDPFTDFAPVITLLRFPMSIAVTPSLDVNSLQELAEAAKTQSLNYGSLGIGTAPHLTTEMFLKEAGVRMVPINYKATAPMLLALQTNEVQVLALSPGSLLPLDQAGHAKILAVDGQNRFHQVPDVPTFSEAGFTFKAPSWWGVVAPAGTPPEIIAKVNADIREALENSDFRQFLSTSGFEPVGGSPEELAELMRDTKDNWEPIITELGIKIE